MCIRDSYELDEYITETYKLIGKYSLAKDVLLAYQRLYRKYLKPFYTRHHGERQEAERRKLFGDSATFVKHDKEYPYDYAGDVVTMVSGIEKFLGELEKYSFPMSELAGYYLKEETD